MSAFIFRNLASLVAPFYLSLYKDKISHEKSSNNTRFESNMSANECATQGLEDLSGISFFSDTPCGLIHRKTLFYRDVGNRTK